jgi:cobalt-zinc-cadmium efflux system membrane fusion protein
VLKKQLLMSLLILLFGLLAGIVILRQPISTAGVDSHQSPAAPATPRGPHQGRLFRDGELSAEIQIYENGIPPEFHVWFWHKDQPVPVSEVRFSAQVIRLGQTDRLSFRPEHDYLVSNQSVYEPHSFAARFEGVWRGRTYRWRFSQSEGRVTLAPELVQRSGIEILRAGPRTLETRLRFPGQIALDQDKYVHVVPPIGGRVLEVYKHVGEPVRKGELLAVFHSRELADLRLEHDQLAQRRERNQFLFQREATVSRNTHKLLLLLKRGQDPESIHRQMMQEPVGEGKALLLSRFAELRLARQTLRREQQLRTDQLNTQESLQTAQAHYDSALANYIATVEDLHWQRESALQRQGQELAQSTREQEILNQKLQILQVPARGLQTARFELRAPISGLVTEKHLALGESVNGQNAVFVIADLSVVWAELLVPESQLGQIRFGQRVRVSSQDGQQQAEGTISHISPVVDPDSRRAESHAHILNPQGLWRPGMFVNVEVTTDAVTVPLAVSRAALQHYNDWTVVYAKFGEQFEIRPLELGREDAQWVEVTAGLQPGQPYAASNSFILKAEIGKKAATHDH